MGVSSRRLVLHPFHYLRWERVKRSHTKRSEMGGLGMKTRKKTKNKAWMSLINPRLKQMLFCEVFLLWRCRHIPLNWKKWMHLPYDLSIGTDIASPWWCSGGSISSRRPYDWLREPPFPSPPVSVTFESKSSELSMTEPSWALITHTHTS